jgi:hypothetical protein
MSTVEERVERARQTLWHRGGKLILGHQVDSWDRYVIADPWLGSMKEDLSLEEVEKWIESWPNKEASE